MATLTYVERFAGFVTQIVDALKDRKDNEFKRFHYGISTYDLADRTQRMALIHQVADDYVSAHADVNQTTLERWIDNGCKGQRPSPISLDTSLIDRLTDAVLDEELTDMHPDKVTRTEYPFMSDWQLELRRDRETSLKIAEEIGTDGKSYAVPHRRKRSGYENRAVDRNAKIRNVARAAQYKHDIAPGPIVTYNLNIYENGGKLPEEFVTCRGVAELWRERLSLVY